ncbi:hypothetical protein HDU98_011448 [Podochytrium sp. JEL0797]|nr:hypothetical protein HDU98_011448 [Podochytrium sp. JEL0797]
MDVTVTSDFNSQKVNKWKASGRSLAGERYVKTSLAYARHVRIRERIKNNMIKWQINTGVHHSSLISPEDCSMMLCLHCHRKCVIANALMFRCSIPLCRMEYPRDFKAAFMILVIAFAIAYCLSQSWYFSSTVIPRKGLTGIRWYELKENPFCYFVMDDDCFQDANQAPNLETSYHGRELLPQEVEDASKVRRNMIVCKLEIVTRKQNPAGIEGMMNKLLHGALFDLEYSCEFQPSCLAEIAHFLSERMVAIEQGKFTDRMWRGQIALDELGSSK